MAALQLAISDDRVVQLQEFVALHLICGDDCALFLATNFPIIDRFDERALKEATCLIDRSARSFQYSWLRTAAVDTRDAKVLSLLVNDSVVPPVSVAGTVFTLPGIQYPTQCRRIDAAQYLRRIVSNSETDEYGIGRERRYEFKAIAGRQGLPFVMKNELLS
jgi:hypothetical protein